MQTLTSKQFIAKYWLVLCSHAVLFLPADAAGADGLQSRTDSLTRPSDLQIYNKLVRIPDNLKPPLFTGN